MRRRETLRLLLRREGSSLLKTTRSTSSRILSGAGVAVSAAFELVGGRPNKCNENEIL